MKHRSVCVCVCVRQFEDYPWHGLNVESLCSNRAQFLLLALDIAHRMDFVEFISKNIAVIVGWNKDHMENMFGKCK